jgi:proteic killer suppression protein
LIWRFFIVIELSKPGGAWIAVENKIRLRIISRKRKKPRTAASTALSGSPKTYDKLATHLAPLVPGLRLYSVAFRYTLLLGVGVIESIKHKGLRRLYEKDDRSGIRPDLVDKVQKVLSALEAANGPEDMALPLFRFHPLTGDRRGTYAVTIKANWRITFRFHEGAAQDVNLEDYH